MLSAWVIPILWAIFNMVFPGTLLSYNGSKEPGLQSSVHLDTPFFPLPVPRLGFPPRYLFPSRYWIYALAPVLVALRFNASFFLQSRAAPCRIIFMNPLLVAPCPRPSLNVSPCTSLQPESFCTATRLAMISPLRWLRLDPS